MTSSPSDDAWLIYPAVKAFIRICAAIFGAGTILATLIYLFLPVMATSPQQAAGWMHAGTWAALLCILSLSCISIWGSRVLLASRGNRVTRVLSLLTILPALYALLIPFTGQPVSFQYAEMGKIWHVFFLLVGITAFFAFPYTRGYPPRARKLFLAWAIVSAWNGLLSFLFFLFILLGYHLFSMITDREPALLIFIAMLILGVIQIALPVLCAILAWILCRDVTGIASLPELQDPEMPGTPE